MFPLVVYAIVILFCVVMVGIVSSVASHDIKRYTERGDLPVARKIMAYSYMLYICVLVLFVVVVVAVHYTPVVRIADIDKSSSAVSDVS